MSLSALLRLEGRGLENFEYPLQDGTLRVGCHQITDGEELAACTEAGVDLETLQKHIADERNQSKEVVAQSTRLARAFALMACYCIEQVEGYEKIQDLGRKRDKHGFIRISTEVEDELDPVLQDIGQKLWAKSKVGEQEGEV